MSELMKAAATPAAPGMDTPRAAGEIDLRPIAATLWVHRALLAGAFFLSGALAYGASYLVKPVFTSTTTFLPPQQQQSMAASALSSLGSLAGLAGGAANSPAEEFISLMKSETVANHMVDHFKLLDRYRLKYRSDARKRLASVSTIAVGRKDGIISVSVDDDDPQRAADMANQYVTELRSMTNSLAISEAQQRRVFFEKLMQDSEVHLVNAQMALQATGITAGAIKAEPQAAAEQYAQLRAQATAAEVKLETLRASLAESAPEIRQVTAQLAAVRSKLQQVESSSPSNGSTQDYIGKYREFKYQEALFEILSKQYEAARVDESREGGLVQVIDTATPADLKSSPKRRLWAEGGSILGLLAATLWVLVRNRTDVRTA